MPILTVILQKNRAELVVVNSSSCLNLNDYLLFCIKYFDGKNLHICEWILVHSRATLRNFIELYFRECLNIT